MTIREMILSKYKNIDDFIRDTNVNISRTYIYQIINGEYINPTLDVIEELAKVLDQEVKDVFEAIYRIRHRD